jgi:hypothetical protein
MAREEHVQAVGFAGIQVEEIEHGLAVVREELSKVRAIIVNAVGDESTASSESGRAALQSFSLVGVNIAEAMDACEATKQHLNDYGRGI